MLNIHANPQKLDITRYNQLLNPCPKGNSLKVIWGLYSTYLKKVLHMICGLSWCIMLLKKVAYVLILNTCSKMVSLCVTY